MIMKAILPQSQSDFIRAKKIEDKERIKTLELITYHNGQFRRLALIRWFMGRAATSQAVYCTVRLSSYLMPIEFNETDCMGFGMDATYGQDRTQVSFHRAIQSSGVILNDTHTIYEPETVLADIAQKHYNKYENLYFARC